MIRKFMVIPRFMASFGIGWNIGHYNLFNIIAFAIILILLVVLEIKLAWRS